MKYSIISKQILVKNPKAIKARAAELMRMKKKIEKEMQELKKHCSVIAKEMKLEARMLAKNGLEESEKKEIKEGVEAIVLANVILNKASKGETQNGFNGVLREMRKLRVITKKEMKEVIEKAFKLNEQ